MTTNTQHADAMIAQLPRFPSGTVVVVNKETGAYIAGQSEHEAL